MTTTQSQTTEVVDMITVVIDGFEVSVPKGTLVIRAAEKQEFPCYSCG
jgi:NADH-quinone oxidoreductase subunit G